MRTIIIENETRLNDEVVLEAGDKIRVVEVKDIDLLDPFGEFGIPEIEKAIKDLKIGIKDVEGRIADTIKQIKESPFRAIELGEYIEENYRLKINWERKINAYNDMLRDKARGIEKDFSYYMRINDVEDIV